MSCGCDCGSILVRPAVTPVSPLEIVSADNIIAGWDAAVRVDTAGAVSVLPDVSGNGFNLSQAIAANQPTVVVGGGPNGNDSILFDGVDDYMFNPALDLPMPGTTPTTYWGVLRQVTWTGGERFWDAGSGGVTGLAILQLVATPQIVMVNGAASNLNGGLAVNIYAIVESLFGDSPSDFLLAAGVLSTGVSAGNTDPLAGFTLGADAPLTGFSNIEVCELWIFSTALTIQQRSQLRAYATNRYGAIP